MDNKDFEDLFADFRDDINKIRDEIKNIDFNKVINNIEDEIKGFKNRINQEKRSYTVDKSNLSEFIEHYNIVTWVINDEKVLGYRYRYRSGFFNRLFTKNVDRIERVPMTPHVGQISISFNPSQFSLVKDKKYYSLSTISINVDINTKDVLLDNYEYLYSKEDGVEILDIRNSIDYDKVKEIVLSELSNKHNLSDDVCIRVDRSLIKRLYNNYTKTNNNLPKMIEADIKSDELPDKLSFYIED